MQFLLSAYTNIIVLFIFILYEKIVFTGSALYSLHVVSGFIRWLTFRWYADDDAFRFRQILQARLVLSCRGSYTHSPTVAKYSQRIQNEHNPNAVRSAKKLRGELPVFSQRIVRSLRFWFHVLKSSWF